MIGNVQLSTWWFATLLFLPVAGHAQTQRDTKAIPKIDADVLSVMVSPQSDTWIATKSGLAYYAPPHKDLNTVAGVKIQFLGDEDQQEYKYWTGNSYVTATAFDTGGELWAATDRGIYRISQKDRTAKPFLTSVAGSAIAVDHDNEVWAGSLAKGVAKISPLDGKVRWYTMADGLPSNQILALNSDDKEMWAGTASGLAFLKGSKWMAIQSLAGQRIFSTAKQGQWVFAGTDDGVYFGNANAQTWKHTPTSAGKVVTAMKVMDAGVVAGTKDGMLFVYRPDEPTIPIILDAKALGLSGYPITSITKGTNDSVLVGSFGGGVKTIEASTWNRVTKR